MRYAPPGLCLNDFALLGPAPYVLIHLQGPWTPEFDATRLETSYGRAISHDLISWEPLGPVFGVGAPGRFDDGAVWTMHPFQYGEGLAMAYSGVSLRPDPRQAIGMAFSDRTDGTGWRRAGDGPVTEPDPRWYRVGPGEAWRDPWIVADAVPGANWAMLTAALSTAEPPGRAGCAGLATSDDLVHWEIHPPALIPGDVAELECPVLERYQDGWLLLASIAPARHIAAWTAEKITGPWQPHGPIAPAGPYAPRLIDGPDGERLVLHTVPRRVGLRDDGPWCRGMLAQPKVLWHTQHGPRLAWWPRLEESLGPELDDGQTVGDAVIDIDLGRDYGAGGGLDAAGQAPSVFVEIRDHLLVKVSGTELAIAAPGGRRLQEGRAVWPPSRLRILTVGEYVEVYADDMLVLCTASYGPHTGRVRCWAGHRRSRVWPVRIRPLRHDDGRDDASALWRGDLTASR